MTDKFKKSFCLLLALCFCVCTQPPAKVIAAEGKSNETTEEAEKNDSDERADVYTLPTIMVTAEKREAEAQKTPMALTVINSQQVEDIAAHKINDILKRIPNLSVNGGMSGANYMSFRGATTSLATDTNPLVIYVDGVPSDTYLNLDADLQNIERIEVLRGAQSVVYGKNAFGGIVNIISKKPDNIYQGRLFGRLESYDGYMGGFTLSGPIAEDKLYFSISAQHDQSGGYMDTYDRAASNKSRYERVKGQLRATPTTNSDFTLHFDYTASRAKPAYKLGDSASLGSFAKATDFADSDVLNLAFSGKVSFDNFITESITTFRYETLDFQLNMNSVMPLYSDSGRDMERTEVTQEFRIRSREGAGISWLAGIYGSYADMNNKKIFAGFMPVAGFDDMSLNQPFRQYTREIAPFAQAEMPLVGGLKANFGLRWHYTHKAASVNFDPTDDLQAVFGYTPMHTRPGDSWSEFLPKFGLSWQINDSDMVYAGVSRSFIPGGFNYASSTDENLTYDATTAWNYEVGTKTGWFDNRLNANLTFFLSEFDDLQIMDYDASTASYMARNAGKARSYGAEIDFVWRIADGLDLDLSGGFTHAEFRNYKKSDLLGNEVSYKGNRVPYTPRFTGIAGLQYRHPSGFFGRAEVTYSDKIYWDDANEYSRSDVVTVNSKIGYEGENFDIYLYGKNIFGECYISSYAPASNMAVVAAPQTFGLEIAYRF